MGAPAGNQNAAKSKQWAAAIERAIERLGDPGIDPDQPVERTPYMRGIDQMATDFVLKMAAEKDLAFYKEFGDRMDGRAKQQIEATGSEGGPLILSWHNES